MSQNEPVVHASVDGAIAVYDERQKRILRGEIVGLITFTVLALIGVLFVTRWTSDTREAQGFRADYQYNYAGIQKVDYATYLTSVGKTVRAPDAEAVTAYNTWVQANPKTKNIQVLSKYLGDKYTDTATVFGYMSSYVVPGTGESCQYCHNLQDFSSDELQTKVTARQMMVMQFEVQKKWVNSIPKPEGQPIYQISCRTCHNGVAKFWNNDLKLSSPKSFGIEGNGNPYNYDILDQRYLDVRPDANGAVTYFKVIADKETKGGLADVARNQNAMYHLNQSLGVGCDYCHYGGYFRSYQLPDGTVKYTKAQARHMMGMMQDIAVAWLPQMKSATTLTNTAQPNCYMCHRGNVVPPGDNEYTEPLQDVADPLLKPSEVIPVPVSVLPK